MSDAPHTIKKKNWITGLVYAKGYIPMIVQMNIVTLRVEKCVRNHEPCDRTSNRRKQTAQSSSI
eukprot:8225438-Pyramimonas_sp.AAC.1